MKQLVILCICLISSISFAQQRGNFNNRSGAIQPINNENPSDTTQTKSFKFDKTTIDQYKIISFAKDTTFVDTTLTITSEYKHNYLRKDNFGLLQFANEGHVYNTLYYGLKENTLLPGFGFKARHVAYLDVNDINYYNVATPLSDLFYKSVIGRGQNLDAFVTANLNPNLNLGIGYKGLRSTGKYFNDLTSNGNFRLLASYNTTDKRYYLRTHFTSQDFSLQENGGISSLIQFEDPEGPYSDRARADVYLEDAKSKLKGNRYFFDHSFRLSKSNPNSLVLHHQFNYENKSYSFENPTLTSRFGDVYSSSARNKTRYNRMFNQVGIAYKHEKYGSLKAYVEDINYNYYYDSYLYTANGLVLNNYSERINTFGVNYFYQINRWKIYADAQLAFNGPNTNLIDIKARYKINDINSLELGYQNMSKLPDLNYVLHQSAYQAYNWYNNFLNEKINAFSAKLNTNWLNVDFNYQLLKNHLYFANTATNINADGLADQLIVKPFQYADNISYLSLKANKEFKFGKFGSDHTLLYQKVDQEQLVLNVPEFVTRNSVFYNNHFFDKALYLQTGVTFNYFTKYFANDYNPILGEMTVQTNKQIGEFPTFDYFLNAKIKTFRLFLKAENINGALSKKNTYYASPNYPYRDFTIRFGLIWNFFS